MIVNIFCDKTGSKFKISHLLLAILFHFTACKTLKKLHIESNKFILKDWSRYFIYTIDNFFNIGIDKIFMRVLVTVSIGLLDMRNTDP